MVTPSPITVSRHAVEQYRARVLCCPERRRSDAALRERIAAQAERGNWRLVGGETFAVEEGPLVPRRKRPWEMKVAHPLFTLVIERRCIVTVLGYMMRPTRKKSRRIRRRRLIAEAAARAATAKTHSEHPTSAHRIS
jgi:hypothetical protein